MITIKVRARGATNPSHMHIGDHDTIESIQQYFPGSNDITEMVLVDKQAYEYLRAPYMDSNGEEKTVEDSEPDVNSLAYLVEAFKSDDGAHVGDTLRELKLRELRDLVKQIDADRDILGRIGEALAYTVKQEIGL